MTCCWWLTRRERASSTSGSTPRVILCLPISWPPHPISQPLYSSSTAVHSLVSTDQLTGNPISQLFFDIDTWSSVQRSADCCPRPANLYTLLRQQCIASSQLISWPPPQITQPLYTSSTAVHGLVSTDQLNTTPTSHPLFSSSTSMSGLVSTDQLTATPD